MTDLELGKEKKEVVDAVSNKSEGSNNSDLISNLDVLRVKATLAWQDLSYTITKGHGKKMKKKVILDKTNGIVKPGEMVAILGSSGAGKTTLLNALAGRIPETELEGTISLNGERRNKFFGSVSAYVEQDDVMMPTLTVVETLRFAAMLRLPKSMSRTEKYQRVDQTIAALGLGKVRNNRIGDVKKRGISGGERKRTSIAIELLTNPSLLFLDEPTSGLDSFNAYNLAELMGRLSKAGRTVLMTIHQPRANLFDLFDKVMFLSRGKVVYFGTASDVVPYFTSLGYPCPTYYNSADFVIDIITVDARNPEQMKESETRIDGFEESYTDKFLTATCNEIIDEKEKSRKELAGIASIKLKKFQINTLREVQYITYRNWLNFLREKEVTVVMFVQTALVALIVGAIFFGVNQTQVGIQNRLGALFFVLLNIIFTSVMPRLNTFEQEFAIFKRERASNTYRALSYLVGRILVDLWGIIGLPIVFLAIAYFMIGFQANAGRFFTFLVILWVSSFCARSFGLAISAMAGNVVVAQVISILVLLVFMLFGGLYANSGSYSKVIGWIQWISYVGYGYKAVCQNEFTGLTFTCNTTSCIATTGEGVLKAYALNSPSLWVNVVIILAMGFCYLFMAYLALKFRSRPKVKFCDKVKFLCKSSANGAKAPEDSKTTSPDDKTPQTADV